MTFESWIDRQIREAQERGEFDNLPGSGKPLTNLGRSHDEMWWVREKLEREGLSTEAALPTSLKLRKEISRLAATVRPLRSEAEVRETVSVLNEQIKDYLRAPSGPQVPVGLVDVEDVVQQWRQDRADAGGQAGTSATVSAVPAQDPSSPAASSSPTVPPGTSVRSRRSTTSGPSDSSTASPRSEQCADSGRSGWGSRQTRRRRWWRLRRPS